MTRETENLLQTYSFEELLEMNDKTEEEVLDFLLEEGFIQIPEPYPLDYG